MIKNYIASLLLVLVFTCFAEAQENEVEVQIFDRVLFYDGYNDSIMAPPSGEIIHHKNSLYGKRLDAEQLDALEAPLSLKVEISADCDNYDRLAHVYLALVEKGAKSYTYEEVQRIEIARFITPFMDKHKLPAAVNYDFEIPNVLAVLQDEDLRANYDFWLEFEVFGVPYAAQKEIKGCEGISSTFYGSLSFIAGNATGAQPEAGKVFLLPLASGERLNNYDATDKKGETTRIFNFEIEETIDDAKFFLITSNHGAGRNGEEYVRRWHYVYFNGDQVLKYKPGGKSCEPFRGVNTQRNGIYGREPKSETDWTSWNNWCPGDKIPIREIDLGKLEKGSYSFEIKVPEAEFEGEDGNIPVSLYLQGYSE